MGAFLPEEKSMLKRLIVVRHGSYGSGSDASLDSYGIQQVTKLSDTILIELQSKSVLAACSPLRRAIETARAIQCADTATLVYRPLDYPNWREHSRDDALAILEQLQAHCEVARVENLIIVGHGNTPSFFVHSLLVKNGWLVPPQLNPLEQMAETRGYMLDLTTGTVHRIGPGEVAGLARRKNRSSSKLQPKRNQSKMIPF